MTQSCSATSSDQVGVSKLQGFLNLKINNKKKTLPLGTLSIPSTLKKGGLITFVYERLDFIASMKQTTISRTASFSTTFTNRGTNIRTEYVIRLVRFVIPYCLNIVMLGPMNRRGICWTEIEAADPIERRCHSPSGYCGIPCLAEKHLYPEHYYLACPVQNGHEPADDWEPLYTGNSNTAEPYGAIPGYFASVSPCWPGRNYAHFTTTSSFQHSCPSPLTYNASTPIYSLPSPRYSPASPYFSGSLGSARPDLNQQPTATFESLASEMEATTHSESFTSTPTSPGYQPLNPTSLPGSPKLCSMEPESPTPESPTPEKRSLQYRWSQMSDFDASSE